MLGRIYQKHVKRKVFNKLILIYSVITICSLVTLAVFAYQSVARDEINNAVLEQQRHVDQINRFMNQKVENAQILLQQLYQDNTLIGDAVYFLENGYESYIRYRLDQFSSSVSTYQRDFDSFYTNAFYRDLDIQNIILFSNPLTFAYMYTDDGRNNKLYDWQDGKMSEAFLKERYRNGVRTSIPEQDPSNQHAVALRDDDHRYSYGNQLVTVTNRIYNSNSLTTVGTISIDFSTEGIDNYLEDLASGERYAVLNDEGQFVYHSSEWNLEKFNQQAKDILRLHQNQPERVKLEGDGLTYVTVSKMNKLGLTVIAMLPQKGATAHLMTLRNTIGIVSVVCIAGVLLLTMLTMSRLSRRTQSIVYAMKQVQEGNLNSPIPVKDGSEDELGLIAKQFNRMCEDLVLYINRVYKSELKQKQAELVALQAQIKPHFLYNTLEVIRMRAVAKGAHDVGEMIYNLASLFRHMVKDKAMISLKEEIESCKRYLELTRLRYRDKLQYTIQMDEELGGYPIMKLSIQPIIENYLLHGLGLDRTDNHITIDAAKREDAIIITVTDNGKGIEPERLKQLQEELQQSDLKDEGSLGLKNVLNRLKILYGDEAELTIKSSVGEGTTVTLIFPLS
ncbi:sensor histidine kinase [Paenibacillus sp. 1001270B_150601_E10]|uniref:sensor histidine kinase n=1 Tax=Paenibacillus sp. 1001270B_150601_E10 TaxID=2787079 RepID=UPI0018A05602|nr:sensor histidine kinase [Paenibacillus sp. 1001270B_150601_E10]